MSPAKVLRQRFYNALLTATRVVGPIFSVLLSLVVILGLVIAWIEDWRLFEGVYFAFVTGLTVGYGDFVPKHPVSRILAILIGFHGVMLTGLFAAVTVRALQDATQESPGSNIDQIKTP